MLFTGLIEMCDLVSFMIATMSGGVCEECMRPRSSLGVAWMFMLTGVAAVGLLPDSSLLLLRVLLPAPTVLLSCDFDSPR